MTAQAYSVSEGNQATDTMFFEMVVCHCGIPFMIPSRMRRALRESKESFYCPSGHGMSYSKSTIEIEKEKFEKERSELQATIDNQGNRIVEEMVKRQKVEKDLKRLHKGVCTCCNRSFSNLERHIRTQHPELVNGKPEAKLHRKINKKTD